MAKDKNPSKPFVSPFGDARYPYLTNPDTQFDEAGTYKVGVILTDTEATAIKVECDKLFASGFPGKPTKNFNYPIKETEDGTQYLLGKSTYKPKVYDAKKKPLPKDVDLGGGSIIRVAGNLSAYVNGANKGVTFYLQDVQYKKLVARGGTMMDEVEDDVSDADDASDAEDNDLDI